MTEDERDVVDGNALASWAVMQFLVVELVANGWLSKASVEQTLQRAMRANRAPDAANANLLAAKLLESLLQIVSKIDAPTRQ